MLQREVRSPEREEALVRAEYWELTTKRRARLAGVFVVAFLSLVGTAVAAILGFS
jgi:hypothetical protein